MKDLSLHILDIAENSINAGAKNIEITIVENEKRDLLTLEIKDDGRGINSHILQSVTDPFVTTRTTRKVGLGLALLKAASESAGGKLKIKSSPAAGTAIKATFQMSHIDRKPLGDINETLMTLIMGNPNLNIKFVHKKNEAEFKFDEKQLFNGLGKMAFAKKVSFVKDYLQTNHNF
jgi:anti-sigma regulatory factor (Ser/Thr protein kinase)